MEPAIYPVTTDRRVPTPVTTPALLVGFAYMLTIPAVVFAISYPIATPAGPARPVSVQRR